MDRDIRLALLGDHEAAKRLTETGYFKASGDLALCRCPFCGSEDVVYERYLHTRVVMDIDVTGQSNVSGCIFGERNANSAAASQAYIAWSMTSGTTVRSDYFGNSVTGSFGILNSRVTIDKNKNVCDFGGTIVTNMEETGQSDLNMYLLTCNNFGTPNYYINAKL